MKTIAVIEDDTYISELLTESLNTEGYRVIRAWSGTEALLLLEKEQPDLILLDLMLPGLSGEQILPRIKKTPVIIISAKTDIDEKTQKEVVKTFEKVLTDMKAKVVNSKDMGQRKLAYPIKKQLRGNYYVFNVEASPAAVKEFDRKAKIDENILRHIVIREEE